MADSHIPAWIYKRDGRLVPFEADKISRALFAATESLGRPDAFLARELTDGVVHFLATELEGVVPTTGQVGELTAKVIRELGQPALAQVYAGFVKEGVTGRQEAAPATEMTLPLSAGDTPSSLVNACLRTYSLRTLFARDIVAAQRDGLLTLTGLDTPLELAGGVLSQPAGQAGSSLAGLTLIESIEEARRIVGGFLAVDGPEFALARSDHAAASVGPYVRELSVGLRSAGLRAIVNIHSPAPPSWAGAMAQGPLFAGHESMPDSHDREALANSLLDELIAAVEKQPARLCLRVDWHFSDKDFLPEAEGRLLRLARLALSDAPLAFVFERPRRPVPLAEGLDRRCSAVLLTVGLHLPRLAEQILSTVPLPIASTTENDLTRTFLHKLGSLARMALSAATQKRDYLRKNSSNRPALTSGFMLDRARLVVAPVGLDHTVRAFLGRGMCAGGSALEFGRQIVMRLREVLREDGGRCQLDTAIDCACAYSLPRFTEPPSDRENNWPAWNSANDSQMTGGEVAGLTAWDAAAPVKSQLRAAGALHALAEAGTATILIPANPPITPEQIAEWLRLAWQQGDIIRLRFARITQAGHQLPLV